MKEIDDMRDVECRYWYKDPDGNSRKASLTKGKFHQWANSDQETANDEVLHITVGIVELANGEIVEVLPNELKFITGIDKPELVNK